MIKKVRFVSCLFCIFMIMLKYPVFHWNLSPTMLHYKNIKNVMYFHNEEFRRK
ncbi:hypothetical protein HMPREF9398_1480 [Streptococcus sanguinis VMC66]|nr:hypothetical protein HMPREF9398_1480 [Streptococcus sanguinis VMC66]